MLKFLVILVLFVYSQSTEAEEWDECLDNLEVKMSKYEEKLKKIEENPEEMNAMMKPKYDVSDRASGLIGTLTGALSGLTTLLTDLLTNLLGTVTSLLTGVLTGLLGSPFEKMVVGMVKEHMELYKPFIRVNQNFLNLVNKMKGIVEKVKGQK